METLKAWLRGEPITIAALVAAVTAAVGYPVAEDRAATIITAVVTVVGMFVARRHTTPAADPRLQTTIAVRPTNGDEEHAGLPPVTTPPVRTLSGWR